MLVMFGLVREQMIAEYEFSPLLATHLLQQDKIGIGMKPQS